jgi:glycosyltransferase involved in cell wall biosynthesis
MYEKPQVSVIVIFLNEEQFLEEAIASVFAQSYARWELLLVDDGSTDGSTAIARQYAQQYPEKVRYLEHEGHLNRGMSASRNLGARHAAGKYIAFLDGDDVWLPNKLEQQVAILEVHPEAAMVYGPLRRWYSWRCASPNESSYRASAGTSIVCTGNPAPLSPGRAERPIPIGWLT